MSFTDAAEGNITPSNFFLMVKPATGMEWTTTIKKNLFKYLAFLNEGTTSLDQEKGLRQSSSVAGFKTTEPLIKALSTEAAATLKIPGVHYDWEDRMGRKDVFSQPLFDVDWKKADPDKIRLTDTGKIALQALEQEFGPAANVVKQFHKDVDVFLSKKGLTVDLPLNAPKPREM